ncbi:site-2 protease family protein [Azotosporobacter soli]|uniref:site-2 protease family protein n=1 Tax=Azotosporobacter soli TaxID=3055040 RepID=UPI0031FF34B8
MSFFDADLIFRIPGLLLALTIHEYAHARVAYSFGDPTAKNAGRMTLNPLSHLDPFGLLMLWLLQFGWAKPVPVNAGYFSNWRKGMFWVSFSGPIANLLTALTLTVVATVFLRFFGSLPYELRLVITLAINYNITFALFNLLPIPPLDGASVLSSYLRSRTLDMWMNKIEPYGTFILLGLVYLGIIGKLLTPLSSFIHGVLRQIILLLL